MDTGVWDPQRVRYYEEHIADKILSMALTDLKVNTLAEIDEAVERSKGTQPWRKLWTPEALESAVAERMRHVGK